MRALAGALVGIVGLAIVVGSVWGILRPRQLVAFVGEVALRPYGLWVAVAIRIVLGACLITAAPVSRFPLVFQALGILSLIAAAAIVFMGQKGMKAIVVWFTGFTHAVVRGVLTVGVAFGGFLAAGVWS
jgi:hypothetical protein